MLKLICHSNANLNDKILLFYLNLIKINCYFCFLHDFRRKKQHNPMMYNIKCVFDISICWEDDASIECHKNLFLNRY